MYPLLRASFDVIAWRAPSHAFLKRITTRDAVITYSVLLALLALETLFLRPTGSVEAALRFDIGFALALDVVALAFTTVIGGWVINRYAKTRFSLKDMFVLQVLLTAGCRVIFAGTAFLGLLFGEGAEIVFGIFSMILAIYLLFAFQSVVSSIASITRSQAAYVILAPIILILGVWLVFLMILGGTAALM
jgi:hypothetical protein